MERKNKQEAVISKGSSNLLLSRVLISNIVIWLKLFWIVVFILNIKMQSQVEIIIIAFVHTLALFVTRFTIDLSE